MQDRFEKCIASLEKKRGKIPVINQKSYRWFAPEHKTVIDDCINSLKDYEKDIINIITKEPKNKDYYEAHFQALVMMLETIQNKELSNLNSRDFQFVVPESVNYHRTRSDIDINTELGMRFGFACSFTCIALPILGILMATGASLSFGLIPFAVILLGSLIGAAVGYLCLNFTPYPRESEPSNCYILAKIENAYTSLQKLDEELSNEESKAEITCFG